MNLNAGGSGDHAGGGGAQRDSRRLGESELASWHAANQSNVVVSPKVQVLKPNRNRQKNKVTRVLMPIDGLAGARADWF